MLRITARDSSVAVTISHRELRISTTSAGLNGNIRACTDSQVHIRSCQGRGIIDAVTHHDSTAALLLELFNTCSFIRGQHLGNHPGNAHLPGNGLSSGLVVAGKQHYLPSRLPEGLYGGGAVRLHNIRHGDKTQKPAFTAKYRAVFPCRAKIWAVSEIELVSMPQRVM